MKSSMPPHSMLIMSSYLKDFFSFIYPRLCQVCKRETPVKGREVCLTCLADFPYTNHFDNVDNPLKEKFFGRADLIYAAALINYYKGSIYTELVHRLKYEGDRRLGPTLGKMAGRRLVKSGWAEDIDAIVPVPLHKRRLNRRGYNQSYEFARGVREVSKIPIVTDLLLKVKHTSSQINQDRQSRLENVADSFKLSSPEKYQGKHLLIVDDVVTTGATIEACALNLVHIPDVKLSMLTIGWARY